ncbi:MAG: winged helix DNA-binding domain-containing protein [Promethearchaeota archaeon]
MVSVTLEQVRLNHLIKQIYLDLANVDFYKVAKMQIGLHSTDYWTPYLSAWARIGDYDAKAVFNALNSGQQLVRLNSFRGTVHVIHTDNLPLVVRATGPRLERWVRKHPFLKKRGDSEIDAMLGEVLDALKNEPLRMRELKAACPKIAEGLRWLMFLLAARGLVVRATAPHARSTQTAYARLDKWSPGVEVPEIPENEAIGMLLQRYVEAFGPVSVNDFAWWLPWTKTKTKKAIEAIDGVVSCELQGNPYYIVEQELEAISSLEFPAESLITFFPYEDHFPKAFIERFWYVDDGCQERLYPRSAAFHWPEGSEAKRAMPDTGGSGVNQSGEIRPSIWCNGEIVGRWEFGERDQRYFVVYDLYKSIPAGFKPVVEERRQQLEEFVNERLLPISQKG